MEDTENQLPSLEELEDLAAAMDQKYTIAMKDRQFKIICKREENFVFVTTLLQSKDESFHYPVETKMDVMAEGQKYREAVLFLIDYIDTYFEEFLMEEEEQLYLPIDWKEHQYEAVTFLIRGQIKNLKIEKMADALLNEGVSGEQPI